MALKTPPKTQISDYIGKVGAARELLRARAEELLEQFITNAKDAQSSGDHETAAKSLQWLLEHLPADDDGARLVDRSVDKVDKAEKDRFDGPRIQIGLAVGPMLGPAPQAPAELPAHDVEVVEVPIRTPRRSGSSKRPEVV